VNRLLYAPPDVGPAFVSQVVARPDAYRRMSRALQDRLAIRSVRPAGAGWLRPRLNDVSIRSGLQTTHVERDGDRVRLQFSDASEQTVDHVMLGTGYRVDLSRYGFLDPKLVRTVTCVNGYPRLAAGFETSVPGLHIVGAPAAWSFGPLMRFVAGSGFAARELTRRLSR
jgi:hypothetical protein